MSPDELRALADRVVACRHWRPMRGMRDLQGRTWTPDLLWRWHPHDRPDLSDPATLGCLLALVREAWGKSNGHTIFAGRCGSDPRGWRYCWASDDGRMGGGIERWAATEAEALVAALEDAP